MNRKGFTLVETLVVVVIIGAIMFLIVPKVSQIFSGGTKKAMQVQENELKDAALMYLEDHCKNPYGGRTCAGTIYKNADNTYSGYILIDVLNTNNYIDKITYQENVCGACVKFTNNSAKAYIDCGEDYITEDYASCQG